MEKLKLVVDYIKKEVAQGYSIDQIRAALVKYGYGQAQIDSAISEYQSQSGKKEKPTREKTINKIPKTIFVATGIIALGIIAFLLFSSLSGEETKEKTSLEFNAISTTIQPGQNVTFIKKISTTESKKISFNYQLIDEKGNTIKTEYETLDISKSISSKSSISIPEDASLGKYNLKITYSYDDVQKTNSLPVKLYEASAEPSCNDNILNQGEERVDCGGPCEPCRTCPESCDDNDPCTEEYCDASTEYECKYEIIEGCGETTSQSGTQQKEEPKQQPERDGEKVTLTTVRKDLHQKIQSSPVEAAQLCETLSEQIEKDLCLKTTAELSNQSKFCQYIERSLTKDSCYMKFVTNNNEFEHCEIIQDEYLKDSCETLEKVKQVEEQYEN